MALYSRIANVLRKPVKCPVWDIVYGTGDMTEVEFLYQYRKNASMGGDRLPRRPPMWECCCGCMRFRKVNADGTDAKVKLKMLKDMRPAPHDKNQLADASVQRSSQQRQDGYGSSVHG